MYLKYRSLNTFEYDKLVKVIESCKTEDQFNVAKEMFECFGIHCDFRDEKLKKDWLNHIWNIAKYKVWKEYRTVATEQIDSIVSIANLWVSQYQAWLDEQKNELPSPRIRGFANLSQIYECGED